MHVSSVSGDTNGAAARDDDAPDADHDDLFAVRPRSGHTPRIGEMMTARGLISDDELARALEYQRTTGRRMGEILVEMGAISPLDLTRVLAERLGYSFIDLRGRVVEMSLASLIPEDVARRYDAIPIARRQGEIVIAMANPENVFALDDLRVLTQCTVVAVMADRDQIREAIDRTYTRSDIHASVGDAQSDFDEELDPSALAAIAEDGPIIRLVNALLEQAINERASDIHVEPLSDRVRIRFRTDGVLHEASETPTSLLAPLISRVKVLGGIDITRRRTPQDGRFTATIGRHELDVRVATLPTAHGEAAVLRLLDRRQGLRKISSLGIEGDDGETFARAYRAAQGWVLVSGPTGSGKTSTLYATLAELNTAERSIISVEDPIEYRLDGIKQIQINNRAGLTFPAALRSILRSDPDVVLVGEIRDGETARIAAEAAITGHLVFSTLHTTRAAAVPMRLIDMGVEPYLVASSLTCAVAQRLARRLCDHCAEPDTPAGPVLRELGCTEEELAEHTVRRPVGCPACQGTGYHGRFALYEVMAVTEDISRLILANASTAEIERWAIADGMNTLRMAALQRVLDGQLSVDEMLRVVN